MFRALHVTNIIREGCQPRVYLNIHPFAILVPTPASGYFFHVDELYVVLLKYARIDTIFLYKSAQITHICILAFIIEIIKCNLFLE